MIKVILLSSLFLCACTNKNHHQDIHEKITGQWNCNSCSINFIHAAIDVPLTDNIQFPKSRIEVPFSIEFMPRGLFSFNSEHVPTLTGKYAINDTALVLTLENDSSVWLRFNIDSIRENTLYMNTSSQQFFSVSKQSVQLLTGDDVKFKLVRIH